MRPCGVIKESYVSDMAFFEKNFHYVSIAILAISLIILPFVAGEFLARMLVLVSVYSIALMGLNLLTRAHLFSVMTAAIMGVGAFTAAFISESLPFPIVLFIAGLVASGTSVFFMLPSLRIKVFYLLFSTTAAQFIIEYILNWSVRDVPGSVAYTTPMGIFGYEFTWIEEYYTCIGIAALLGFVIAHIGRTPLGKAIVMIGEKDYAAQIQGISLLKFKSIAAAISGFYAGVGGALWAYALGLITPEHFPFLLSWEMLGVGVIVGGLGSYVWGSILGAIMMIIVSQYTTVLVEVLEPFVPWLGAGAFGLRAIIYGIIIAAILIFEPHGLASLIRKVKRFFDLWPFTY
jgi:branched-chain amino acid transport system permease protein